MGFKKLFKHLCVDDIETVFILNTAVKRDQLVLIRFDCKYKGTCQSFKKTMFTTDPSLLRANSPVLFSVFR